MSKTGAALYVGSVMHRRLRPQPHRLRYRVFSLFVDIDALHQLDRLRLFSLNRFNLFGLHPRDYVAGASDDLRAEVEKVLRAGGVEIDGGPIRLLTMPRILGYAFNPLSIFFSYRRDGALNAVLYEVNNTFGERHSYLFPVDAPAPGPLRHCCEKEFYVSPFIDMAMRYSFRMRAPDEVFALSIEVGDAQGALLHATHSMKRVELTDGALLRVFLTHPLLTLKVILGIHYEALRLWLKGARLHVRPPPPQQPVTVIPRN